MKSVNSGKTGMVVALAAPWLGAAAVCAGEAVDPAAVRQAAFDAGLAALASVPVPTPPNINEFLNNTQVARPALLILGKALFWDMQVGSDGQACASCHFNAFADNRTKNQFNPDTRNVDPALQSLFGSTASGATGGPNYDLVEEDFPFHILADVEEENFLKRIPLFDTNDVVSSQGVFRAKFLKLLWNYSEWSYPVADPVFRVNGKNTRRVEPRNTPTIVNAVFNSANFWDGRAHNVFNGQTVFGPLDTAARVYVKLGWGGVPIPKMVRIPNSSLASQAVGPPVNDFEMSFIGRPFKDVGRKLLHAQPLALQRVHPKDSVLGPFSLAHLNSNNQLSGHRGLWIDYGTLIKLAFKSTYWAAPFPVHSYSHMELNFAFYFGIAVQAYEATLVSDDSAFDQFMDGDDAALDDEQLRGLLTFIRTPASNDPVFTDDIGIGNCVSCHSGPEFTSAAFTSLAGASLIDLQSMPALKDGLLAAGKLTAFADAGFANIGVRTTPEDLGRGGTELNQPLSFARQSLNGFADAPPLPPCEPNCPDNNRVAVDGAFKIPGLRNVELTGPFFHNGGQASLEQVIEFYDRQSDFGDLNIDNLDQNLALIDLDDVDEDPLVQFLLALTDDRVRDELAPFDHPEILVPNGHPGDHLMLECVIGGRACDDRITIPGVGRYGRPAAGLPPLEPFLGLDPE